MDNQALGAIRAGITHVLKDFLKNPYFDMRERDVQARIFHEIRSRIEPKDVPLVLQRYGHGKHSFPDTMRTSRVHCEVEIRPEGVIDIGVFKANEPVTLRVHVNGPLDVIKLVREEDLVGIIEVKAAPSKNMWKKFSEDLKRLQKMISRNKWAMGYFAAFDKSLHLGGTNSNIVPNFKWLDVLEADEKGNIEAYWLSHDGKVQVRRGNVVI